MALFVLKWTLIAALPALAVWGTLRLLNQPEEPTIATQPAPTVATPPAQPSPAESPSPPSSPAPSPAATPSPAAAKGKLQVLNGSNTAGLALKAAERLRKEGYEVVNVDKAAGEYEKTVVFFQPGHKGLADQVARILGATEVKPAPGNLNKSIPVTVVIGNDYKPS